MTLGLAVFHGGMISTAGVLNMIMVSVVAIPLVPFGHVTRASIDV